jgi:pyrroloquinoline-quinone synthase
VEEGKQDEATEKLVATYKELTSTGSVASGAASLYAFESQIPAVASAKIEGLRDNYGIDDEKSVSFFSVHKTLDEVHSEAERDMVESLVKTEEELEEVVIAVETATDALCSFLDGVYKS